jgi:hypothetical protein
MTLVSYLGQALVTVLTSEDLQGVVASGLGRLPHLGVSSRVSHAKTRARGCTPPAPLTDHPGSRWPSWRACSGRTSRAGARCRRVARRTPSPAAARLAASRSPRPTRCTSCTPPAPRLGLRAWSATTEATRSRCGGAWKASTISIPARCSGPPPTWAGPSGIPTPSTLRCWPGARPCCTRASRWAPPTSARSGGSSPSTGQGAVHRADRVPGDQEGGPGRQAGPRA